MDKVIVTTGGTGGHIFPALSIIEAIKKHFPNAEVLFIGGEYGKEKEILGKTDIPFIALPSKGFQGKGIKAIAGAWGIIKSIFLARKIIDKFKPQVVIGCGGYASFATVFAALLKKIPCILHEQNAIAGSSNRILAKFGAKVCASFPGTKGFKGKFPITGNPIRKSFFNIPEHEYGRTKNLLILGGSQGAHALNIFITQILPLLKKNNIELLHQCGKNDIEFLKKEYEKNGYNPECVKEFIHNMDQAYSWADFVFCRAGASTVAELAATGSPSLCVPFPAAIHDHQTFNAMLLVNAGGAYMIHQEQLNPATTGNTLITILNDPEKLLSMSNNLKKLAKPDAADKIVNFVVNLIKSKP